MRVDVSRIRWVLEEYGRTDVDLSNLHVTYVRPGDHGPILAQLKSTQVDGATVTFTVRSAGEAKGKRWVTEINNRQDAGTIPGVRPLCPRAVYDPCLEALITSFPVDRRLTTLLHALDERTMRRELQDHFASMGSAGHLNECRPSVVRYKSESKCVIRYDLDWRSQRQHNPGVLYGKLSKRSIFERSKLVVEHAAELGNSCEFETPEWFGTIDSLSIELWGELRGVPFAEMAPRGGIPVAHSVGRALRSLHALRVDLPVERAGENIGSSLIEATHHLSKEQPDMASELMSIVALLTPALESSRPHKQAPTHHDFHGHNLLIDGKNTGLLDFEDLALGDRFHDVGALLAHLVELEIRSPGAAANYEDQRAGFLAAYGSLDSAETDRLATYSATHCVLRAYQALRKPGTASHDEVRALIHAAKQFLQGDPT